MVRMVMMARTEAMVTMDQCLRALSHMSHASSAQPDHPAIKDHPDKRDQQDPKVPMERMERTARRVKLDFKDLWDSKGQLVPQDLQDQRELQAASFKSTDPPDLKELPDHPETPDPRVPKVGMDKTPAVQMAHKETMATPDQRERPDLKDLPASKGQLESQEAASTAHPHVPHQGIKLDIRILLSLLLLINNIPIAESKFTNI